MTSRQALAFIRQHGVVLEAAYGPVPSLAEAIAGERVQGSWWSHRKGHEIFTVTRAVRDSDEVLVCRLIKNKVTFVHRRLWPPPVRAAGGASPAGPFPRGGGGAKTPAPLGPKNDPSPSGLAAWRGAAP